MLHGLQVLLLLSDFHTTQHVTGRPLLNECQRLEERRSLGGFVVGFLAVSGALGIDFLAGRLFLSAVWLWSEPSLQDP
ncbi:hypothetical protein NDU88_002893 [Pleurodeles waltl]|uniref:Uncharacterized protein n=1 Tax=Pleurodeles waltl TaxID=8319 RepID=A0AAV7UWX1_PLEWA|nr:hypothetical protein NDU88_002893 [Pleurodeles waltl]